MADRSKLRLVVGCLVGAGAVYAIALFFASIRFGGPAAIDIAAYWSALRVLTAGGNPYDNQALFAVQQPLQGPFNLIFWNPPWLLPLLSPVLALSFSSAVLVWLLCNVCFIIACGCAAAAFSGSGSRGRLAAIAGAVLFVPNYSVLGYGQLGLMIAASLSLFVLCAAQKRDFAAGLALVPATCKPHILYLFWITLLLWIVRTRRWRVALGACAGTGFLTSAAAVWRPTVVFDWLGGYQGLYTAARSPTLGSLVRSICPENGALILFAMVLLPAAGAAAAIYIYFRRPAGIDWRSAVVPLSAWSLLLSPYSMFHDHAVLLLAQAQLAAFAAGNSLSRPRLTSGLLCAVQAGALLLHPLLRAQHHYVWFPAAVLFVWQLSGAGRSGRITPASEA